MAPQRRKIAILGGGIGALTTAFELTARDGWQDRYEIDLYQLGFRLGGKGASGCNRKKNDRIEEHGLHIWMGFYRNAFSLIRRCYDELARPPGAPLASWRTAFTPHDFITWEESAAHWFGPFRRQSGEPGDPAPVPTPADYARWLAPRMALGWWHMAGRRGAADWARGLARDASMGAAWFGARALPRTLIGAFERRVERDDELRRLWVGVDLVAAILRGMLTDGVLRRGFDAIDGDDFRAWLGRHGARALTLDSALVRGLYDFVFAYERGDEARPSIGAGTVLRVMLRMLFDYRGAIFYRMNAGMGETVFAPLYQLLRRRGVRFHFFHRADRLRLSPDGAALDAIELGVQATPKSGEYQPLIDVAGLPCWPTEPLYDQLVEGDALAARAIDLESAWSGWPDAAARTLRRGADFDDVVLGIPLGALPPVAAELIAARAEWRNLVEHVRTVPTQAMQLWLKPDLPSLGWRAPAPILTGHAFPHSTWADFSHLLGREQWSQEREPPRSLAYFCGPLRDQPPARGDVEAPARADRAAKADGVAWLDRHAAQLWPRASQGNGAGFDWSLAVAPDEQTGRARADAQYFRANINPSDRYVQSLPGSSQHRLRADGSGVCNLWLAGDWVRTGLNLGCIEAAVMAGRQAARAIDGRPMEIPGERDLPEAHR
ncbi:MAG TPA: NAD(P)-binding protein [Polyangia bacterium]|nr:NAD(P)-binding protein [Polyangia bacterium]